MGVIGELRPLGLGTFPAAEARVGLPGRARSELTYGRSFPFKSAQIIAIAEALERFGGWHPMGKRTTVRGSFRELEPDALDPKILGLYPAERFQEPSFPYQIYHDDLKLWWVWGYSFREQRPLLVPESCAYYGTFHVRTGPDRPFVNEVSNGCAVGSCIEEAILHGLLEICERDAFLMTWWAKMQVPRLDPNSARNVEIPLMVERLRNRTGYDIAIFSTTLEQRIPSFWTMAIDHRSGSGLPKAVCLGGANLDPEKAVVNGLHELGPMIDILPGLYSRAGGRVSRMVEDPIQVREMGDHTLVYCHPRAFERFGFLFAADELHTFEEYRELWQWPRHLDLRCDLAEIVGRFLGSNLDVIVVDQTSSDHHAGGLVCVKVIVPGALPITFGHQFRRVDGLPRLFHVPHKLGYSKRPLTSVDINSHPHPFP
jgi:ribosomal protein S12 methylthiotransferase accessory factor